MKVYILIGQVVSTMCLGYLQVFSSLLAAEQAKVKLNSWSIANSTVTSYDSPVHYWIDELEVRDE